MVWPRIPARVLASTPLDSAWVENVCPYGIIRTNRKTLAEQRVDWFVLILFPLKTALNEVYGRGVINGGCT